MDHILQEHDNNPATGPASDLLGSYGGEANPTLVPEGLPGGAQGGAVPPPTLNANTTEPQAQVADLQATNFANPE